MCTQMLQLFGNYNEQIEYELNNINNNKIDKSELLGKTKAALRQNWNRQSE